MKTMLLGAALFLGLTANSQAQNLDTGSLDQDFNAALASVRPVTVSYAEHYQALGQPPESLNELGVDEALFKNEFIDHIGISSTSSAILVGLSERLGDKQWLAFLPTLEPNGSFTWRCRTTLTSEKINVDGCETGIAYPAIDRTFGRDDFVSTLVRLSAFRASYADHLITTAQLPTMPEEIGVTQDALAQSHISHLRIKRGSGAMVFALSPEFGANQWLVLKPRIKFGNVRRWRCRTTLPAELTENTGCIGGVSLAQL